MRKLIINAAVAVSGICTYAVNASQLEITQANQPTAESLAVNSSLTQSENGVYIVRLAETPVAAYDGNIKGYKATRPQKGKKLNPNSGAVTSYADYLTARHDSVLNSVGGGQKLYSYKYAYNGFAAKMSAKQASSLMKMPGVLSVIADEKMSLDTITTSDMLELETGLWNDLGGKANAGEDIIVGIIDSGVWPENGSFTDRTGANANGVEGKLAYQQIPGWHGKCTPGEAFPASDCNHKLIGAQWFNSGFGGDAAVKAEFPYEYASTRDAGGHGTHTASTAAGNADAPVSINGASIGTASGMAPRARIAAYKVCWGRGDDGGCFPSDSVAAIDQAVIDGVDVLNFSISGSRTSFLDQVEVAFLFAADAGVFSAASAGNSGPTVSTVAHNSPWLLTVAAGTHDRGWTASITTGGGDTYDGASLGGGVGPAPFVYSADVVASGADATQGRLCYPGTLDAGSVSGKIVLCDRGDIARVDKSLAVSQAGGVGMVLANVSPGSQNADFHSVPSIHVDVPTGDDLRAYAQTVGATATISAGSPVIEEASQVAGFSSRGPALAGEGDLLKPDIMAPGVDVIAAVAPPGNGGEDYAAYSGTSMSSPHMAGLAALMKQAHPSWSPAAIKSAFMTTATQSTNLGNPIAGDAFGYGAGFVQPNKAIDPGLVYDAGFNDWLAFLCGTGQLTASYCPSIAIDPSDLNYPSIAIGSLVGSQTVTRTVTNVGSAGTYTATVSGLAGVDTVVSPASLTLASGQSGSYQITFTTTAAASVDVYTHGAITWSDGIHDVRSPIAIRPVQLDAPSEVSGSGVAGSTSFDIEFGYGGAYSASVAGLDPAFTTGGNVTDDPTNDYNTALGSCNFGSFPFVCTGITWHIVPASPGGPLTRISLFDDNTDGQDDLDLYVYDLGFAFQGGSGSGTSAEEVNIVNPASPAYVVAVHGWQTDGADANYTLFSWSPNADSGNTSVTAPGAAVLGGSGTVTVDWSGLTAPNKYMGVVKHSDGGGTIKQTVIRVDTP